MSLRHIRTYNALTRDNIPTLNLFHKDSNISFNLGLALQRWTKDLDVSLLKKQIKFCLQNFVQ